MNMHIELIKQAFKFGFKPGTSIMEKKAKPWEKKLFQLAAKNKWSSDKLKLLHNQVAEFMWRQHSPDLPAPKDLLDAWNRLKGLQLRPGDAQWHFRQALRRRLSKTFAVDPELHSLAVKINDTPSGPRPVWGNFRGSWDNAVPQYHYLDWHQPKTWRQSIGPDYNPYRHFDIAKQISDLFRNGTLRKTNLKNVMSEAGSDAIFKGGTKSIVKQNGGLYNPNDPLWFSHHPDIALGYARSNQRSGNLDILPITGKLRRSLETRYTPHISTPDIDVICKTNMDVRMGNNEWASTNRLYSAKYRGGDWDYRPDYEVVLRPGELNRHWRNARSFIVPVSKTPLARKGFTTVRDLNLYEYDPTKYVPAQIDGRSLSEYLR